MLVLKAAKFLTAEFEHGQYTQTAYQRQELVEKHTPFDFDSIEAAEVVKSS